MGNCEIITINKIEKIIETVAENESLHDWSMEYIECDGDIAKIIFKSYEDNTFFDFVFKDIKKYNFDIDLLARWVFEVDIEISECLHFLFDGVGVEISCNNVVLQIRKQ